MVQPHWKTVWQFLRKLNISLPHDPAEKKTHINQKTYTKKCSTLFVTPPNWKQLSTGEQFLKNTVTFIQQNILLGNNKQASKTYNNMDESQKHADLRKAVSNSNTLYNFTYVQSLNRQNEYMILESKAEISSEGNGDRLAWGTQELTGVMQMSSLCISIGIMVNWRLDSQLAREIDRQIKTYQIVHIRLGDFTICTFYLHKNTK